MKDHMYARMAERFRILSHEGRLRLVNELRKEEACVCHLRALLQRPQAYVSQQLRVLREAGAIESDKDGLFVYYRLSDPLLASMLEETLGPPGPPARMSDCTCPRCSEGVCSQ